MLALDPPCQPFGSLVHHIARALLQRFARFEGLAADLGEQRGELELTRVQSRREHGEGPGPKLQGKCGVQNGFLRGNRADCGTILRCVGGDARTRSPRFRPIDR